MSSYGYGSSGRWDSRTLSLTVGSLAGIRIRVHLIMILLFSFWLLRGLFEGADAFRWILIAEIWIAVSVLLHEFGHCFGCRAVGGTADDILLWPLGGLAFVDPPRRPRENLITTLSGPVVNLAICVALLPLLSWMGVLSLGLFHPFAWGFFPPDSLGLEILLIGFKINYWMLLFNMLVPVYPLDAGRIVQQILWMRLSYYEATKISTTVGIAGSVIGICIALYCQSLLIAGIFAWTLFESWRTRQELEMMGPTFENEFGYDFSQGYTSLEGSLPKTTQRGGHSLSLRGTVSGWLRKRRERFDAQLDADLDRLLEKIHQEGIDSLSPTERRRLTLASKRRRGK